MSKMKLIMENFRKNMQEGWPGSEKSQDSSWSWGGSKEDSEAFVQKQLAKMRKSKQDAESAIEMEKERLINNPKTADEQAMGGAMVRLEKEFGEDLVRAMHEMPYDDQETAIQNYFADSHPEEAEAKRKHIEKIRKLLKISDPDEDYKEDDEMMPSDQEDPPGYMPGEGGNY
jgi:hypothetical protein